MGGAKTAAAENNLSEENDMPGKTNDTEAANGTPNGTSDAEAAGDLLNGENDAGTEGGGVSNAADSASENPQTTSHSSATPAPTEAPENLIARNDYFVSDSDGDDGNDGLSPETAWKTLAKASSYAYEAGSGIYLKSGDTFIGRMVLQGSGKPGLANVLASYGEGAKPILTSGEPVAIVAGQNVGGWTVRGLEIRMTYDGELSWGRQSVGILFSYSYDGYEPNSTNAPYSDITIDSNTVRGNPGMPDNNNSWGIQVMANMRFDPEKCPPGATQGDQQRSRVLDNITITNNVVSDVGFAGIYMRGWSSNAATGYGNNTSSPNIYYNLKIERNVVHDTSMFGIVIQNTTKGTMKWNRIYNTGLTGINLEWGVGGGMTLGAKDIDIMFNEISDAYDGGVGYDGPGFDIDWASENVTLQYNKVYNCTGPGLDSMSNLNGKFLNNYLYGNKGLGPPNFNGAFTLTAFNADAWGEYPTGVFNNVIAENFISLAGTDAYAFSAMRHLPTDTWDGSSFVDNRIVYEDGRRIYNLMAITETQRTTGLSEVDRNVFIAKGDGAHAGSFRGFYNNARCESVEAWREKTGFDINSVFVKYSGVRPGAPQNLTAERTGANGAGAVRLSWEPPMENAANIWHYNIYRSEDPDDFPLTYWQTMVGESRTLEFIDAEGVEDKTAYYYRVEAETNDGIFGEASETAGIPAEN